MDSNVFKGKWKQVRGRAKQWWGKLTDDDLDRIEGSYEEFLGVLQEKYGYAREEAERQVASRFSELEEKGKTHSGGF